MFHQKVRGRDLGRLAIFADCDPDELQRVDSLVTRLRLESGRVLLREGNTDRQFLIIVDGEVGVSRADGSPLAVLSAGDFAGEMAMLRGGTRSATVTALTPVEILVCNSHEFDALIKQVPSVRNKLVAAATSRTEANALAA